MSLLDIPLTLDALLVISARISMSLNNMFSSFSFVKHMFVAYFGTDLVIPLYYSVFILCTGITWMESKPKIQTICSIIESVFPFALRVPGMHSCLFIFLNRLIKLQVF